jgi:predicted Zn-dependent protease
MQHKLIYLLLCLGLCCLPLDNSQALDTTLPELGNSARSVVTPEREREIGRAFMRKIRQANSVINDPLLVDYIQQIGSKLVNHSHAAGQDFSFFLLDNPQINAFAGPAGYIGINSGLLLTSQTESELASVIAHEIAHVSQQHLLRAWETADNMSIPSAAITLAAIALGVLAGSDAGMAAATVGQAAMLQQQINFTRANEQEADRIGIEILAKAGFETRAMPAFFNRMGKANRIYESKLPEFLRTHPVTENRIADALSRSEQYPYVQNQETLRYQLACVRLQQRKQFDAKYAIQNYRRLLAEGRYRNKLATEYALGLALFKAQAFKQALAQSEKLLRSHPQLNEFIIFHAEVLARLGKADQALKQLGKALREQPGSYALNISYAEVAMAHKRYAATIRQLGQAVSYLPQQPRLYALLAQANGELKQILQAHQHQAQHHYLKGDYPAAILQLETALKLPKLSFYDSAKLDARLASIKTEYDTQENRE